MFEQSAIAVHKNWISEVWTLIFENIGV